MKRIVKIHASWLLKVRTCESRGDYRNRSYHRGAYQFTWQTWWRSGGRGDPADATKLRQDYQAVKWATMIGWANVRTSAGWPNCG
jgi:hypothetical protein